LTRSHGHAAVSATMLLSQLFSLLFIQPYAMAIVKIRHAAVPAKL